MSGIFLIDENNYRTDLYLVPVQGGVSYKFGKLIDIQLAVAYCSFVDVKGSILEFSEQFGGVGNTLENDVLKYDYDSISVSAEVRLNQLLGEIILEYGDSNT